MFAVICVLLPLLQEKKIELKENLLAELEEKRKHVDCERSTMDLTGGKVT